MEVEQRKRRATDDDQEKARIMEQERRKRIQGMGNRKNEKVSGRRGEKR